MSGKQPAPPDQDAEWIEHCRQLLDEFFSPSEAEVADSMRGPAALMNEARIEAWLACHDEDAD